MDISQLIQEKLAELKLGQRDLANAAEVTESYISQLLGRKKLPPAPGRTDIYEKLERVLKLPPGKLSDFAELQRRKEFEKRIQGPPAPLLGEVRELLLRKCMPAKRARIRKIFEREPFGEFEHLITQKMLAVVQGLAREELGRENWVRTVARESGRSYKQMRVALLEFLDADIFSITPESCIAFMDPLIVSWNMDLSTFSLELVLNGRLAPAKLRRFEFIEREIEELAVETPGLREFCRDRSLSGDATPEEMEFLRSLTFKDGRSPNALYYYRELQNLRDPLHFRRKEVSLE